MKRKLRAVDLFCGAGGSTTGAIQSGAVDVVLAVNHWRVAIYSHQDNHPETRHICARIDDIDPRHDKSLPDFDLLMASPECTHHSIARGGRPIDDQKRATPWHVCVWAEAKRPKWIVCENVREFQDWGPIGKNGRPLKSRKGETFAAWIDALRSLGYHVEWRLLNAADYGEATKRIRLFVVARRGRSKAPIPWPEPTHAKENWRPAWSVIDWSRPAPSIFARKRPLADKTLRRIEIGLRKFVGEAAEPFIVKLRGSREGTGKGGTVHGNGEPLGVITAGGTHHALATPFVVKYHGGSDPNRDGSERSCDVQNPLPTVDTNPRFAVALPFQFKAMGRNPGATKSVDDPIPTIVAARENHSIVVPYLIPNFGERDGQAPRTHDVNAPLPAVTSHGAGAAVLPFLMNVNHGGHDHRVRDPSQPLNTVTATRGHAAVLPFLTKYHGTGGANSVEEPLSTVTTKPRVGLAMAQLLETMRELSVIDVGFRMLDVDELARAQGFPEGYVLRGNKAEQIRQVGNAVCPGVMRAICLALAT